MAGCIVLGAAELLLRAGMEHLSSVNALTMQLQHHAPSSVAVLVGAYRMSGRTVDEEELARMMGEYMASDRMYSQDINDLLDSQENAVSESSSEGLSSGFPQEATATAGFVRIAPRKKTSVLVVLNAMYKAGWFVDADGGELTNRDAVLNDILNHAFGIDKATAISQTINPSNNINGNAKMNFCFVVSSTRTRWRASSAICNRSCCIPLKQGKTDDFLPRNVKILL